MFLRSRRPLDGLALLPPSGDDLRLPLRPPGVPPRPRRRLPHRQVRRGQGHPHRQGRAGQGLPEAGNLPRVRYNQRILVKGQNCKFCFLKPKQHCLVRLATN